MTVTISPHSLALPNQQDDPGGAAPSSQLPVITFSLIVAFGGLFAAAVLSVGHWMALPIPCGANSGCMAVANHPASKLFGVPIAYLGVMVYMLMILMLARAAGHQQIHRLMRRGLMVLAGLGGVSSLGLMIYSKTVIKATCPWCVGSGVAMMSLAVLSALILKQGIKVRPASTTVFWLLAMLMPAAVGVQAGLMERTANAPPIPPDRLASVSAEEFIDDAKSIGPANAPITIVMFGDPWCPACGTYHHALADYQRQHSHSVRFVYRHMPLWEMSGATAAIGEIAAEQGKFWPYIKAVYSGRIVPAREAYFQILRDLGISTEDVEARIADVNDPVVIRVWRDVHLARQLGVVATPTFIILIEGMPPVSANQRSLLRILNSPAVYGKLAKAINEPANMPDEATDAEPPRSDESVLPKSIGPATPADPRSHESQEELR